MEMVLPATLRGRRGALRWGPRTPTRSRRTTWSRWPSRRARPAAPAASAGWRADDAGASSPHASPRCSPRPPTACASPATRTRWSRRVGSAGVPGTSCSTGRGQRRRRLRDLRPAPPPRLGAARARGAGAGRRRALGGGVDLAARAPAGWSTRWALRWRSRVSTTTPTRGPSGSEPHTTPGDCSESRPVRPAEPARRPGARLPDRHADPPAELDPRGRPAARARGSSSGVANLVRDLRIEIDDLTAEQKRADARRRAGQGPARARPGDDRRRPGKDPKALERMLGELQSLRRRIISLEDVELEVMERLETAQPRFERVAELAAMDGEEAELRRPSSEGRRPSERARRSAGGARHAAAGLPRGPDGALREAAGPEGRHRRRCPASTRVRGLPAHPERLRPRHHRQGARPTRCSAARSATGSWCAPRSPVCEPPNSVSIVEADGGSRGNPGPSAYGAVLKDAETGEVIAERGETSESPPTTSRSTAA